MSLDFLSAGLPSFAESNGMDTNGQLAVVEAPQQKPWEKPLTIPEIRKSSQNWSLASDAGLLLYLQDFSQKMMTKTSDLEKRMDALVHDAKSADSRVHNTFNDFLMLANTQFIENRVYDDSEDTDGGPTDKDKKEQSTKTREQREAEVIPRVIQALTLGINVLDTGFEQLDANEGNSDSEDEDPTYKAVDPILEAKDMYGHRSLPYIIGTPAFMQDDDVGLMELSEEEDEDESSVESLSDSEKSELSDSEYTDTETESEFTGGRQKMTADTTATSTNKSESEESDTGLFDDEEPSDQDTPAQPMNFQDELASKIGGGMARGAHSQEPGETTDESKRNRSVSEDSKASSHESSKKGTRRKKLPLDNKEKKSKKKRSPSKAEDDNLFGEQPGQEEAEDDSPFGKKGLFSSSGGGLFDDDKEEDGGLFDDKPSSGVRRDVTSDHVYEDIVTNPEEAKPIRKAPPGGVALFGAGGDELFAGSSKVTQDSQRSLVRNRGNCKRDTQKTLLLRACSAAMTRRGSAPEDAIAEDIGQKESSKPDESGGLFAGETDDGLFAESTKAAPKKEAGKPKAKKQVDLFGGEDDSDLFGESSKPQQAPKKKVPAGAVNVFGNARPLGGQTEPPPLDDGSDEGMYVNTMVGATGAGRSKQAALGGKVGGGGGLFDNVDEDLFGAPPPRPTEKPTVKNDSEKLFADGDDDNDLFAAPPPLPKDDSKPKPKKAAAKKNQGLFDDIEGEGEEDFFGGASTKPTEQSKKKPAGGVALFEGADIFGSPPKAEADAPQQNSNQLSPQSKANRTQNTLSLFHDDDDKDEDLFATPPVLPPKKEQLDPNPSKEEQNARRRTKSKSIFDDEAILFGLKNEENPGVDLFGSDTPVPQNKNQTDTEETSEAARKRTASDSKGLFGEDEEAEDDLFGTSSSSSKTTPRPSGVKAAIAAKKEKKKKSATKPSKGLFDDEEEDDLFGESKPKKDKKKEEKKRKEKKEEKEEKKDAEKKVASVKKAAVDKRVSNPPKESSNVDPLGGVGISSGSADVPPEPPKEDPPSLSARHSSKKPPAGAVSMFGGIDPASLSKKKKKEPEIDDEFEKGPSLKTLPKPAAQPPPSSSSTPLFGSSPPPSEDMPDYASVPRVRSVSAPKGKSTSAVGKLKAGILQNCVEVIMPIKSSFPDLTPIPTKNSAGRHPPQTKAKPSPPITIQKNNEVRSQPRRYRPQSPVFDEGSSCGSINGRTPQKALKPSPQKQYKSNQEPPPVLPKFPSPPKEPPPTYPRFPSPPQEPPPPPTYPKNQRPSHEPPPTLPKFPSPPTEPPPPPKTFSIPPPTLPKFPSPPNVPPPDYEPKTHKKGPPTLPRNTNLNNDLPPPPSPVSRLPSPADFPRPPSFLDNPNHEDFPPPPPNVIAKKTKTLERFPTENLSHIPPSSSPQSHNGYTNGKNSNLPSSSPNMLRRLRSHSTEDGASVVVQSRFAPIRKTNSNGAEWTINHENRTLPKNITASRTPREDKPMKRVPARPPPLKFLTSKVSSSPPNSKSRPVISEPLSPKGLHSGALKNSGQSAFVIHGDRRSPGHSPAGSPLSDKSLDFEKDDLPIFSAQVLKNGYRKPSSPRAIGKSHDAIFMNRQSPRRESPAGSVGSPSHHQQDNHHRWDADLPPPPPPPSYRINALPNGPKINGNHKMVNSHDVEVNFAKDIEAEIDGYDDNVVVNEIRNNHLRSAPKSIHTNNAHVNGHHSTSSTPPQPPSISPLLARKAKAGKKQPPPPAQKPAKAPVPPPVLAKPAKVPHGNAGSAPSRDLNGHMAARFSSSPPSYPKSSNTTNSNNVMVNAHMSIISNSSTCSQFSMNSLNLSNISANSHDSFTTVSSTNTYNPHNSSLSSTTSSNSSNSNSVALSQKRTSFESSIENGHSRTTNDDSNQNSHCPPNELCKMSLIQKIALFSHKKDRPSPPSSPKNPRKSSPIPIKPSKNPDTKSIISSPHSECETKHRRPPSPKWTHKGDSPIPSKKITTDHHYHEPPPIQRPSSPRGTSDTEWKRPPVAAVSEQFEACIRRTPSHSFSGKRTVSRTPSSSSTERSDSDVPISGGFTFPRPSKIKKQKGRVPLPHENTNSASNLTSATHTIGSRGVASKRSVKEAPPKPLPKPCKNLQKAPVRLPDAPSCPSSSSSSYSSSSSTSYTPSGTSSSSNGSVWRKAEIFKANLNIDPTALKPGAAPPERAVESSAVGFDRPAVANTLDVNPNKTRARVSAKRRPPSRRSLQAAAAASASDSSLWSDSTKEQDDGFRTFTQNLASDQPDLGASIGSSSAASVAPLPSKKPKTHEEPPPAATKPKKPSDNIFSDDLFSGANSAPTPHKTVSKTNDERPFSIEGDSQLFAAATTKQQPSRTHDNDSDIFAKPPKINLDSSIDDIFASPPVLGQSSKQSSMETDPLYEDIFAPGTNSKSKRSTLTDLAINEDLFGDIGGAKPKDTSSVTIDEDLFGEPTPAAPTTATTKPKKKKSAKKAPILEDDDDLFAEKPKKTKTKAARATDQDLFGSSDIFADLPPAKPKEKKKKKTTAAAPAAADDSIFKDITGDDIFADPSPTSKPKKTKAKKKTSKEASDSIFDTDAPNIFDDPLNAMNN